MSGFDASEEALIWASGQLTSTADDLDVEFRALEGQVAQLLSGAWHGGAARGFATGWGEWVDGYEQAVTALRSMAELLSTSGVTYGQAEGASTAAIRDVGGTA